MDGEQSVRADMDVTGIEKQAMARLLTVQTAQLVQQVDRGVRVGIALVAAAEHVDTELDDAKRRLLRVLIFTFTLLALSYSPPLKTDRTIHKSKHSLRTQPHLSTFSSSQIVLSRCSELLMSVI